MKKSELKAIIAKGEDGNHILVSYIAKGVAAF